MDTNEQVSLLLEQVYTTALLNKKVDSSLSVHGLSFTQFIIMHNLLRSAGGTMSRIDLAGSIGLTASGITRILAPMNKYNLIVKTANARDARKSMVAVSSVGKELYGNALVTLKHTCQSTFALLDEGEIAQLLMLLNKIKC